MYVVVNTATKCTFSFGGEHPVMPLEEPHTYETLESALEQVVDLHYEHGHTPETAVVYELVPVPTDKVQPLFEKMVETMREDYE